MYSRDVQMTSRNLRNVHDPTIERRLAMKVPPSHFLTLLISLLILKEIKIRNDQELIQADPISCPQNQKGKN